MSTPPSEDVGPKDSMLRSLWREPIFIVVVVVLGVALLFAVALLPAPGGKLDLAGWGPDRRFTWASGIFNTLLGAGVIGLGLALLDQRHRERQDAREKRDRAREQSVQEQRRKDTSAVLLGRVKSHVEDLAVRVVGQHHPLLIERLTQLRETHGVDVGMSGYRIGEWNEGEVRRLASAAGFSTIAGARDSRTRLIDRQLLLTEVVQELIAGEGYGMSLDWPDLELLRAPAASLMSTCDSVLAALTLTESAEDMERVSNLQRSLAGRIEVMLQRPEAAPALLKELLRWLDPRDPPVSYEVNSVAERLGFSDGITDVAASAKRRELLSPS